MNSDRDRDAQAESTEDMVSRLCVEHPFNSIPPMAQEDFLPPLRRDTPPLQTDASRYPGWDALCHKPHTRPMTIIDPEFGMITGWIQDEVIMDGHLGAVSEDENVDLALRRAVYQYLTRDLPS